MTRDEIIEYIGPTINAQLTLTWYTKQSLDQYIDLLDGQTPRLDDFLEYVIDNAIEEVKNQLEGGTLTHEVILLTGEGEEVWGNAN
jgi:hypothetical protein